MYKPVSRATTCTVTYRYTPSSATAHGRVTASIEVHGHTTIVDRARIRGHQLRFTLTHLRRGRYLLTLVEHTVDRPALVIGRASLTVS